MNVILLMIDSLNRTYLSPYGEKDARTSNFERLAKKCVTMDMHWTGSLPTMPARHEVMAGRYDYLWKGWGPLEPYDVTLAQMCKPKNIMSMMLTDTYHYFQEGSGNFHTDFEGWELLRGHERDGWKTAPVENPSRVYKRLIEEKGDLGMRYIRNTNNFREERDFFGPKIMSKAAEWLDDNHMLDKFFFCVDSFDVHEPFHVPPPYDKMFDPDYEGDPVIWSWYGDSSQYPADVVNNIRAQYKGKIAMFDKWFGMFLDRMDRYNLWENTMVIVTTDHGVHLGEHGQLGKNQPPYYTLLTQIPMFVWHPQMALKSGTHSKALTSTIDLYPTIAEALGLEIPEGYTYHGYSMLPFLTGKADKVRDFAHSGYYGAGVVATDGNYVLHKFPIASNQPLYCYGIRLERFHNRTMEPYLKGEAGKFLPYTDCNVFKVPMAGPPAQGKSSLEVKGEMKSMLFDLNGKGDSDISLNVIDQHPDVAENLKKKLAEDLKRIQAPEEQFVRLGLDK